MIAGIRVILYYFINIVSLVALLVKLSSSTAIVRTRKTSAAAPGDL